MPIRVDVKEGHVGYVCLFIFLIGAFIYDVGYCRIPNRWNVCGIVMGVSISCAKFGIYGLFYSVLGALLPIIMLFVLFVVRCIGAGDIKLYAVVGAYLWLKVVWIIVCSFILVAIYGVVKWPIHAVCGKKGGLSRIRMAIPILLSTVIYLLGGPFV